MNKRLFVDKRICTGCRYCEFVCSLVHSQDQSVNPRLSRVSVSHDPLNGRFAPTVCRQCREAPCLESCSFEAIVVDSRFGIPLVDPQKCTACMACLEACPFGAMGFDTKADSAMKCDLCGGDPKCVKFCRALPHVGYSALTYMTPEDWVRRRQESRLSMLERRG